MRVFIFLLIATLASGMFGCGGRDEHDAMLKEVLNEFGSREEITEFGKGDLMLLSATTQLWTYEALRGMGTDPQSACRISEDLYDRLSKVARTQSVAHLIEKSGGWRAATEEQEKEHMAMSSERIDGKYVKSVVSISSPGISADGNEAVVIVSFSWGMHGGLGRYHLQKGGDRWRIHCSHLDFYV